MNDMRRPRMVRGRWQQHCEKGHRMAAIVRLTVGEPDKPDTVYVNFDQVAEFGALDTGLTLIKFGDGSSRVVNEDLKQIEARLGDHVLGKRKSTT